MHPFRLAVRNPIPNGNIVSPFKMEMHIAMSFLEIDLKSISVMHKRYTLKMFYFLRA